MKLCVGVHFRCPSMAACVLCMNIHFKQSTPAHTLSGDMLCTHNDQQCVCSALSAVCVLHIISSVGCCTLSAGGLHHLPAGPNPREDHVQHHHAQPCLPRLGAPGACLAGHDTMHTSATCLMHIRRTSDTHACQLQAHRRI